MKQVRWLHAFGLIAITLTLSAALGAQGDPKNLLLKKLNEQFVPTKFTADKSDIVTAGVVVALKEDGLLVYTVTVPMAPISVPKKGKLTQGFGDMLGVGMVDGTNRPGGISSVPTKKLVAGEKVWVRAIELAKDSIMVQVVTDPYDDGRYFATLKFLIPKGTVPTPEDGVKMISEVLDVQPAQDQVAQQAAEPAASAAPNPAQNGQPTPIVGQYLSPGGSRLLLLPDGSFTKFVGGGQGHGQYGVDEDNLTLMFTSTGFSQHFKIQGGNLLDVNTHQVWARTGDAPAQAAAPAPMPEIAPPPPPADAPPPTVALGQTMDQVTAGFGQPLKLAQVGAKVIFYYKDMKVTFTNGKVSNVE